MALFLSKARNALAQGDLVAVCDVLQSAQAQVPQRYRNEILLHHSSVQKLREDERRGVLSDETLAREHRRLTSALLDLLDLIEKALLTKISPNVANTKSLATSLPTLDSLQQTLISLQSGTRSSYTELEIAIRYYEGRYAADMRFASPTHDVLPATNVPLTFDLAALRALSFDPESYGRQLTANLFADPQLRTAWQQIRAVAQQKGILRLRLRLDEGAPELNALHWELLNDPEDDTPLALSERVRLSRYLESRDFTPLSIPLRPDLRALVIIASPSDLGHFHLNEIDVHEEVALIQVALGDLPTIVVGKHPSAQHQRATLVAIAASLRNGPQLVLLICHGRIVDGEPFLWLEREDGMTDLISGKIFVEMLAQLSTRPLLLVLASCQSGGSGYDATLAAIGPRLARVGVAGVLAFQGNVPIATMRQLLPRLFEELRRDGSIDRALAAARGALLKQADWWVPILWLRVRDGQLWHLEP